MRAIDRDLIRAGHYGQRPGVPHSKAEHMAAPTKAANVKKVLANSEPSTHGTFLPCRAHMPSSAQDARAAKFAATPSTLNKNYLPLLRAFRKVASVGDLFSLAAKRMQRTLSLW